MAGVAVLHAQDPGGVLREREMPGSGVRPDGVACLKGYGEGILINITNGKTESILTLLCFGSGGPARISAQYVDPWRDADASPIRVTLRFSKFAL